MPPSRFCQENGYTEQILAGLETVRLAQFELLIALL